MCDERWWGRERFWKPVGSQNRHWEQGLKNVARSGADSSTDSSSLFRHGASPFRTVQDPPPQFNFTHFWRMMTWGKKAGTWGRGDLRETRGSEESKFPKER